MTPPTPPPGEANCPECGGVKPWCELQDRIRNYFGNGGLFNPEFMEHQKVSELLRDINDAIHNSGIAKRLPAAPSDLAATPRVEHFLGLWSGSTKSLIDFARTLEREVELWKSNYWKRDVEVAELKGQLASMTGRAEQHERTMKGFYKDMEAALGPHRVASNIVAYDIKVVVARLAQAEADRDGFRGAAELNATLVSDLQDRLTAADAMAEALARAIPYTRFMGEPREPLTNDCHAALVAYRTARSAGEGRT